ncbi:hypothetical protein KI387_020860, partial [Taxus chinensis]
NPFDVGYASTSGKHKATVEGETSRKPRLKASRKVKNERKASPPPKFDEEEDPLVEEETLQKKILKLSQKLANLGASKRNI